MRRGSFAVLTTGIMALFYSMKDFDSIDVRGHGYTKILVWYP